MARRAPTVRKIKATEDEASQFNAERNYKGDKDRIVRRNGTVPGAPGGAEPTDTTYVVARRKKGK